MDTEVFFDKSNNYEMKLYLGVLVNNKGMEYVIPLTSAKNKHRGWHNVTDTNYLMLLFLSNEKRQPAFELSFTFIHIQF